MKTKNIKFITIFLLLLICLMGAASAAEDTNNNLDANADQTVTTNTVNEDTSETITTEPPKKVTGDAKSSDSKKLSSSQDDSLIGDRQGHDEIYVNESSTNDPRSNDVHGSSWGDAYGTNGGLNRAATKINNGGTIYLADTIFSQCNIGDKLKNITFIGLNREKTIINTTVGWWAVGNHQDPDHYLTTFINITFVNDGKIYGNDLKFINCTFINFKTSTPINIFDEGEETDIDDNRNYGAEAPDESFVTNFINCDFINSTIGDSNLINIAKYTQINFNNCSFENITADSIVSSQKGKFHTQDSINFKECEFNNVNVKGIVSIPKDKGFSERVFIEDCTYDGINKFALENSTEGSRDYINATKSRIKTTLTGEIDDNYEYLIITLKDNNNNPITNVESFSIKVNDEEFSDFPLVYENGNYKKPLTDLIETSRKGNITIKFTGNTDYKETLTTIEYLILNATSIDAEDLTTEVNVAKDLEVTLKDNNGQALANKEIIVSINGQNTTITTDANGKANIPINYAKAGKYTYTLFFAGDDTNYKNTTKTVTVTITQPSTPSQPSNPVVQPKKVTKKTSKIVASAKTYKAKIKVKKFTITLKSGKKTIRNVKVTLTVNKKKYTAKTKNNGQATFKITKLNKKGTYKAKITFKGNKNYKASNKTVKIIIIKK